MITFSKFNQSDFLNDTIVTDQNLSQLFGIVGKNVIVIENGENAKSFDTVLRLCNEFLKRNLKKSDKIVAVGGGSVGDVVGFCASIFKRGLKLLQVPTTLLAMIDSSIGGKTAINLEGIKNAVGTIYPADTLIDTSFLSTLSQNHFDDAEGEIQKYRLLSREIFDIKPTDLKKLVPACANFKQGIVEQDLTDIGVRRQLNLGHTVGHALELEYNLSHGTAVLYGIAFELKIAEFLKIVEKDFAKNWTKKHVKMDSDIKITKQTLLNMQNDKKNADQNISFVLSDGNFGSQERHLPPKLVEEILL